MSTIEQSPAESAKRTGRTYVVLEEHGAAQLLRDAVARLDRPLTGDDTQLIHALLRELGDNCVYSVADTVNAPNTTSAYRTVVRNRLGDIEGSLQLCAVSAKWWKPAPRGQSSSGMRFTSG